MFLRRLLLALLTAFFAVPVFATQTDNYGIHAVPVPGKVVVDGKLDDWDLSGQVLMCYDIETLRDVYSAQVAMMHDRENFYVSLHWKDPIPMGNVHHPRFQANKGWAGDCVQLRIKTDRISHVTAWYHAPSGEPALQIDYGKSLTEPFGGGQTQLFRTQGWQLESGAEMAFLKDADNKGYVQEIKLPWNLITAPPSSPLAKGGLRGVPESGFACGVELLWGEADWPVHRYADNLQPGASSREFFWTAREAWGPVFLEKSGNLKLPEPAYSIAARSGGEAPQGPVEIRYALPKEARVTIAIDDEKGNRIRNLIAALPRAKGANVEKWDGLDDNGKLATPGAYQINALYHDGIRVNYVMSFANPGNPSWDTPNGRGAFYGDHTAPQAVATAGDYVALACPMGEAGKHLIGCDLKGQRLWGLANRTAFDGGHISLATDGKILWVATEGKESLIYRVDIKTGQYAPWQNGSSTPLLDLKVSEFPGVGAKEKPGVNMSAIALSGNTLAVCLQRENKIKLFDATTGNLQEELSVPSPRGVDFDPRFGKKLDRSLFVLSGNQIINVWRPNSCPVLFKPFAVPPGAYGITTSINSEKPEILVSVRGTQQNVQVFSLDGKLLREIGTRGGRANHGPFDENAMRNPAQIAIDKNGHLWVTEETNNPKRTSVWSLQGKLLRDFNGTTGYAGAGAINPFDPTMAFAENVVWKINLKTGAWRPVYSFGRSQNDTDLFPPVAESRSRVVVKNGRTYLFTTDTARGANEAHVTLFDGKNWRSVAHLGIVSRREKMDQWIKYFHPLFDGHDGEFYAWADANADGLVQGGEMRFSKPEIGGKPAEIRSFYWGQLPDGDGTVSYLSPKNNALLKFVINGFTKAGAPLYEVAKPLVVIADKPIGGGNGEGMVYGGSDGRVYLNQDPLICVDKNGRVLGAYPNRHTSVHGSHSATSARPGYLIGPSSILGTAQFGQDEIWNLNGNLGENYLFTHDSLWVQSLFKDVRGGFETPQQAVRGMSMDATTAGGESFGGHFTQSRDAKVYLTIGGTDAKVLEVTGLNTIKRFRGDLQFTPAQWDEAQKLAQQKAAQKREPRKWTIAKSTAPIALDGKATEWSELLDDKAKLIEIQDSPQKRFARVAARYDAENLYLAWRVFGPAKMRNSGQDARLLFKTGDAVDVMIQPSASPLRNEGLRLLLTQTAAGPQAILYEKQVPGTSTRVPFSSPWRTIYFDRVAPVAEVKFASGPIQNGYFVEAQIPWKTLGIVGQSGLQLRGDVGVLFADSGGTQTTARQYWSNKATGLVNDVPGEADLTPNLWGEFVLE
jgi:hypothetical protein